MMRTPRPFRWVEAARTRHAVPADLPLRDGQEITTLCGEHVALVHRDPRRAWPECAECDRVWREVEGIPRLASRIE
jgi:hypothetical protein